MPNEKSASYYRWKFLRTLSLALIVGGAYILWEPIAEMFSQNDRPIKEGVKSDASKGRKVKYWVAPMDPNFKSDKPGKSPMGMDLVPVYEDSDAEEGEIKISSTTAQNIGVKIEPVLKRDISRTIKTSGRVTYDERSVYRIQSKTKGWIEKLYVDFTGQKINKGDYLMELYSPELVATSEEFLLGLSYKDSSANSPLPEVVDGAEALLESARRRLEFFDVPDHQIRELEKTRKVKKTLHIHSPASGVVVEKNAVTGMQVTPGTVLYVIADLSHVWVLADIYEYEMPWVRKGQTVSMSLTSLPGSIFKGAVTYIYPFMEKKTRTIQVRMEFDNPGLYLKPDMYSDVEISSDIKKSIVAIPRQAVIRSGSKNIVMVSKGSGRFEPREVKLGIEGEDYQEIIEGLRVGENIVVSANFLLDSESNLHEMISKMPISPDAPVGQTEVAPIPDMEMEHSKMDHSKMDHGDNK